MLHPHLAPRGLAPAAGILPALMAVALQAPPAARAQAGYTLTPIALPGAQYTDARGINAAGQVVGSYQVVATVDQGFVSGAGTYRTVDPPGALNTVAYGINAAGQVVGTSTNAAGFFLGSFLYAAGAFTPLAMPGADLTAAYGINDAGQIVGEYYGAATGPMSFLATPVTVPEPTALALLAAGLGIGGGLRRLGPAARRRRPPIA